MGGAKSSPGYDLNSKNQRLKFMVNPAMSIEARPAPQLPLQRPVGVVKPSTWQSIILTQIALEAMDQGGFDAINDCPFRSVDDRALGH